MSNRVLAWLGAVIVLTSLCLRLGHLPLLAPDEGRNAEVGREMKNSGAWLVPTYNGLDYLDKPAFFFKAVALSLAAFGDNETAARLPSALFGLALVGMTFAFCRKVYGLRCGLLAGIIVATMPLFLANARTVIFDMTLAFFVCGAIFSGFLAESAGGTLRRKWYLLGAASAGCATLVKGPVGFIIPILVLLAFNFFERRPGACKRLFSPLNFLVFFAIALPWFIGLCLVHPDFFNYGIVEESFHRFTTAKAFHRSEPFYFYAIIVAVTFLPWSLILPEAGFAARKQWGKMASADRLCIVWSLLVVLFFSISQSKLPGYILSVTVACGILVARVFEHAMTMRTDRIARMIFRATITFAIVCAIGAIVIGVGASETPRLAKILRIPVSDAAQFQHLAKPLIAVLAAFALVGIFGGVRKSVSLCFLCFGLFAPVFTSVNVNAFNVIYEAKSGRRIAAQLAALPPQTEFACLNCFPNGVPFYLGRTATLISEDGSELTSNYIIYDLKKRSQWPGQIVPLNTFDEWLAGRKTPVYLIFQKKMRKRVQEIADTRQATIEVLSPSFFGVLLQPRELH